MPTLWSHLRDLVRRMIRPFMAARELAYYGRRHCRWPSIREGSWGVTHVVCGAPPVDVVDVGNLQTILKQIESGNEALAEVLPKLLSATTDETGGLAVCPAHKAVLLEEITTIFSSANQQDQERLKEWLRERK